MLSLSVCASAEDSAAEYPVLTSVTPDMDGFSVSWQAYSGAVKYRLFYRGESGWIKIGDTESLSYTHRNLTNLQTYRYTVRAMNRSGAYMSSFDATGLTATYYSVPTLKKVENENGGQRFSWNAVPGAPLYGIYCNSGSGWRGIGVTTENSFFNADVKAGVKYTYRVRVMTADAKKALSDYVKSGASAVYVATPEISSCEPADGGILIKWGKVTGAAKYRLFYKGNNGWVKIADTTANSYTHKGLSNNQKYRYTVRALNSSGAYVSGYNKTGVEATYYATPAPTKAVNEYGGQRFSWNAVPGAPLYGIYCNAGSGWRGIGVTTENSFFNPDVKAGVKYTYRVRVMTADAKKALSDYNKAGVSCTYVESPEITGFTPVEGGTQVKWNAVSGASKYRLFVKSASGWTKVGDTADTKLTHTGLNDLTVYTYTVRAMNASSAYISGYNKAGAPFRYIAPPAIKSITKADTGVTLSWNTVNGAASYRVYRKDFGGAWTKIAETDGSTYTDTQAPANTAYTYTLRCLDEQGGLASYFIGDTKYYYNGAIANGKLTTGGVTVNFNNGSARQGYVTVGGKTYYYDSNGTLKKGGIVGSDSEGYRYADKNGVIDSSARLAVTYAGKNWNVLDGVAYQVTTEKDKTLHKALKLVAELTTPDMTDAQKLRKCFDYLQTETYEYNPRVPHYKGTDWPIRYANDIFDTKGCNCFSYAAAFGYMAKAIGYGNVFACHSGGHGWTEIGGLVYDAEWQRSHHTYSYYGLSYYTSTDVNYKAVMEKFPGNPWMHVKL